MRYREIIFEQTEKHFVGTCINAFDEDGDCVIDELPWSHVSDLGYADENAVDVSPDEFHSQTIRSPAEQHTTGREVRYLASQDGVLMLYDVVDDVHYFYV